MNNIIEQLNKIIEEIYKDKKRVVVNTEVYNLHKDAFDQAEKNNHVIIHHYDMIPKDKIYVVGSQREFEALMFKPLNLKLDESNVRCGKFHPEDLYVGK